MVSKISLVAAWAALCMDCSMLISACLQLIRLNEYYILVYKFKCAHEVCTTFDKWLICIGPVQFPWSNLKF